MQFILGALVGFGIAIFSILVVFFTFLIFKALFSLLISPMVSFEVFKAQPAFFYPLFKLIALDLFCGLSAFGCFKLYKKFFKKVKKERNSDNENLY